MRKPRDEEIAWKETGTRGYRQPAREGLAAMEAVEALTEIPTGRRNVGRPETRLKYESREES